MTSNSGGTSLFYHLKLRAYIVIEFKLGPFETEYAGKMNFYMSAVDNQLRHAEDKPSIGLILCKERNRLVVEYSLQNNSKPIRISRYQLNEALPDELRQILPSAEALQDQLSTSDDSE